MLVAHAQITHNSFRIRFSSNAPIIERISVPVMNNSEPMHSVTDPGSRSDLTGKRTYRGKQYTRHA